MCDQRARSRPRPSPGFELPRRLVLRGLLIGRLDLVVLLCRRLVLRGLFLVHLLVRVHFRLHLVVRGSSAWTLWSSSAAAYSTPSCDMVTGSPATMASKKRPAAARQPLPEATMRAPIANQFMKWADDHHTHPLTKRFKALNKSEEDVLTRDGRFQDIIEDWADLVKHGKQEGKKGSFYSKACCCSRFW